MFNPDHAKLSIALDLSSMTIEDWGLPANTSSWTLSDINAAVAVAMNTAKSQEEAVQQAFKALTSMRSRRPEMDLHRVNDVLFHLARMRFPIDDRL